MKKPCAGKAQEAAPGGGRPRAELSEAGVRRTEQVPGSERKRERKMRGVRPDGRGKTRPCSPRFSREHPARAQQAHGPFGLVRPCPRGGCASAVRPSWRRAGGRESVDHAAWNKHSRVVQGRQGGRGKRDVLQACLAAGGKVGSLAISVRQEKRKRATGEFLLKRAADGATIGPACGSPTGDVSFAGAGKDSRRNSCTRHVLLISPTESLPFRERFCLSSIISVISHG